MAWYNMVPALTPLAVFDADSAQVSGALQDRSGLSVTLGLGGRVVGAYHIASMGEPLRKAVVNAVSTPMPYSSAVPFPTEGLCIALIRPGNFDVVLNASSVGGSTILYYSSSVEKWKINTAGTGEAPVTGDVWQVAALWWNATTARIFLNDNWADTARAFTTVRPSSLAGMVWGSSYYPRGGLAAHGLFSGAATLSDIQAIATELNSQFLLPPLQGLSTQPQLAPTYLNPLAQQPVPPRTRGLTVLRAWKNIHQGGAGTIQGTVTIENIPGARQVRLFDKRSGLVVAETWSSPTGHYEFNNVAADREYFVVAHDHLRVYNAVVQDMLTP